LGAAQSVPEGWRVGEQVPDVVTAAGLQPGDLIVAVNGSGPNDIAAALNAVSSGHAELTVQRGADRLTISVGANRPT
jgi:S1-C subfamily serine protease